MLGQPVSMLIPRVVGFKLNGALPEGATATDLVLTITEMLRQHKVVGKFVEFYGPGVSSVPLANRATIGNMSPEYGSTIAVFPIDSKTTDYLRLTGRDEHQIALVEAYAKEQGLWHDDDREPRYSEYLELDLSTVVPSIAGPKRPQDRVVLTQAKQGFREALAAYVTDDEPVPVASATPDQAAPNVDAAPALNGYDESVSETFPASDPVSSSESGESDPHEFGEGVAADIGRPSRKTKVTLDGQTFELDHGAVTIASITSCTNTSNPSVMIGAALVAKKAVERGLTRKPWVKTTLAPGSKVVTDYYDRSGLTPYLDKLGFNLVGYGCTTCIGNSGPLIPEVSQAVQDNDLAVVSVLSGNRNFEGRINPDVKMNYLASPPLVVAYALAGTMDTDLVNDPLGTDEQGRPVYLRDVWPTEAEIDEVVSASIGAEMFAESYADVFAGDAQWQALPTPEGDVFEWDADSTYVRKPPYFEGMPARAAAGHRHRGCPRPADARRLDHDRPHLAGRLDQGRQPGGGLPARARGRASRLQLVRLAPGQPRGDDPGHVREHPPAQPARAGHRGRRDARLHRRGLPGDDRLRGVGALPRAGHAAGRPGRRRVRLGQLARLGGEGHGAARRQGRHRAVVRAHPPLEPDRHGRPAAAVPGGAERVVARPDRGGDVRVHGRHRAQRRHHAEDRARHGRRRRVRRRRPDRHPRRGGLLPQRRDHAVRPALAAEALATLGAPDCVDETVVAVRPPQRWSDGEQVRGYAARDDPLDAGERDVHGVRDHARWPRPVARAPGTALEVVPLVRDAGRPHGLPAPVGPRRLDVQRHA